MILNTLIWSTFMVLISGTDKTLHGPTEEAELLKFHLQLYRNHCGEIVSCDSALGNPESPTEYVTPVPCCLPCPCQQSCSNNHDCCPDFGLYNDSDSYFETSSGISTTHHDNQDTVKQKLAQTTTGDESPPFYPNMSVMDQHQSQQLAFDLDNHTDDVPQSFTDDAKQETTNVVTAAPFYPHTICIRPQVFNTPNFYIDSQGYMMVKYCFQGNEIVDECYDGHFTNDFSKTLPVTSRLTGLTYLNRFCFMCNEGDVINETVADVWDVMIVHFDNNYDHRFILHPDEFIHHIRVSWKGYINIHFVPRIRNVTQQCEMYDVISCNQTGLWETYDKNVEMVCHNGHSLPILHRISSGYNKLRFKNIACVYCNVGDSFNSDTTLSCGYRPTTTTSHSFSQTLNLRLEDMVKENDKIRGKEYVSNTARAILPIPNAGAKTPCLSGYIALLGRCRRVICPRDHYVSNSKCVPLYRSLTGMSINVKIEISLRDKPPIRLSSDVLNELRKIVKTSLANYVTLQSREITVWYGPRGSKVSDKYYMFDIYLFNSSDTIDFSASVTEIRSFFKSLRTHDSIRILNGDEIMIEINFNHRLVPKLSQYYDMSVSGGGSLTLLEGRTLAENYDRPNMLISNVNWCSRVPFDIDDEAERIGMDVFLIKPVGKAVYKNQYDVHDLFLPEVHLLYLCFDLFISQTDKDTFDKKDDKLDNLMTLDSNIIDGDEKMTLSVPIFITIISVCVCLFVVCTYCKRRSTPTNPPTVQPGIQTIYRPNEEAELLKFHLQLYRNHCGDIVSCDSALSHLESPTEYVTPVPCCLPCPCPQSCSNNHDCCPDLGLYNDSDSYYETSRGVSTTNHHNQDTVNQRLSQTTTGDEFPPFYPNMSVMDQHEGQQLEFDLDNHKDDFQSFTDDTKQGATNVVTAAHFHPYTNCIRPQVFNMPNFYIDSKAYMMVKYCFHGNEIVNECYDGHFTTDFSKILPITSRLTGLTYLNIYCFMCNEGDVINETVADVWDVMIVHYANNYDHRFILHPDEFIHHIRGSYRGYINIHFVPNIRNATQQCEMYDVISCNQTGLWETYDKNVEIVCHDGHSVPILHRIRSGYNKLRFKNIACVYCNVGDSFNSDTTLSCGYRPTTTTLHSFSQTLNLRLEDMVKENDKIRGKEYISNTARAILPIPNAGAKSPCLSGYIALLGRCRRVICPRDHYVSNSKCVPLYRSITGMDINVKIEISLRDKAPIKLSSDVLNELRKIVKTSLANYVTLQSREISVWYGPRGSKVPDKYYMFDIYLFNSSYTIDFSASVTEIRSFFKSLKTHDSIRILNGDEIMIEINFNHRLVPKLSQYYDMSVSGGGSLTVLEGRTLVEVYDRPSMLISNVNWCSRVPLDIDDEAERIGMDVFFIKPVGRAVYNHQYDEHYLFLPEIHLLYVCLDLLIRHADNDTFDITDDDLMTIDSNINDDDEKKKWSVPVFIAIITVCLCLFVVCALCNRRSTPTNMPTVQPEIQVSPDMGIVSDAGMSEDGMQYAGMVNRTLDLDATDVANDVSETEPNSNVVADKRVHP